MSGFGFVLVVVATLFYSFSLATTPPLTDTVNLEVIIAEQSAFDNRSEPEDDILETIRGGYFMLPREVINLIQSGTLPYCKNVATDIVGCYTVFLSSCFNTSSPRVFWAITSKFEFDNYF